MSASRVPATSTRERSAARPVSQPQDHSEREADRAADVVARGGSVTGWSFSSVAASAPGPVQRQEAVKGKSEDEKYKEAAKKAGEAALETDAGKALKERVLADPVVKTVTSPYVLVPAIAGGVAGLAATGKELPIQAPEIPLDRITPGLSGKVTYEGPVNAPTFVGLTITYKQQGPKGRKSSDKDKIAADVARLRAQQQMFKPQSEKAAEKKAEAEMVSAWITSGAGLTIPLTPQPKKDGSTKSEEQLPVQPAPATAGATMPTHASVDAALTTPGRPLDSATRRSMEARFGYDFSRVRIHDDARAAATAASIDASAFTVGEDVVFGAGGHAPATPQGRRLLAHELAHVVQQRGAPGATVHRQAAAAAPSGSAVPRPLRDERFGIGRGGSRVDAELDRSVAWLTAKMKVLFNFVDVPRRWPSAARKIAWRDSFIRNVYQRWSFKHFLVPDQPNPDEPQPVAVRLQVLPVTSNPHFTMNVGFTDRFRTSSVGGRTATMDVLDIERRSDQPQVPAEHEFGHMLGLPHVSCDTNSHECYGVTREDKADVMGMGSYVSPRDYQPFAELMWYFTGFNWRVRQASVIPTSRGPTIGGFLGGLLGFAGGAAVGSLLGPIGALVGGLIGLAGGALLGRHLGTPDVPS